MSDGNLGVAEQVVASDGDSWAAEYAGGGGRGRVKEVGATEQGDAPFPLYRNPRNSSGATEMAEWAAALTVPKVLDGKASFFKTSLYVFLIWPRM